MSPTIAVTSTTFSRNETLVAELEQALPGANFRYNREGLSLREDSLVQFLEGADAAIVALEPVTDSVLSRLPGLKALSKFGVGLDNVDVGFARQVGKTVCWKGGVNRRSVSELTLAFMLGLMRNVFFSGFALKEASWKKNGGTQLTGKTVGIVGCGFIGEDVIRLLQPFHCRVLVVDILDKSVVCECYGARQVNLDFLLRESDIVTLHVPLTDLTYHLINPSTLETMKPEALLINTARGPIVDAVALKLALQRGVGIHEGKGIAGAALDVFEVEPPTDEEFLQLPNLMVTPHIGGNASEAVLGMGRSAIAGLVDFFYEQGKEA